MEPQQAGVHPAPQVHPDRGHVADDLRLGLLEREVHRPLAAAARGVAELRRQRRLAGAGGAADEHRAALVEAAVAEHRVEPRHAGRHPLGGDAVLQAVRGDRQDRDARLADQERILVGPVQRAAVLQDPQPPGRGLLAHPVIEHDHAVRDVLLDAVARQRPVAALGGDHRRHASLLEPAEQPAQLGAKHGRVGERAEHRLDRVDHHPLGADRVDRRSEPQKQPVQVPLPRLLHLAADDRRRGRSPCGRRPRTARGQNPATRRWRSDPRPTPRTRRTPPARRTP